MKGSRGYDAVIFGLGKALTACDLDEVGRTLLGDPARALRVRRAIFAGPHWRALDQGLVTEAEAAARIIAANPEEAAGVRRFFDHYKEFLGPLPSGVALMKQLRKAGLRIYGLSNMSLEAWAAMGRRHELTSLFDGIVVSCLERLVKPDPAIFKALLARYSLVPGRAVFIDDVPASVEAARRLGIDGLHFENHRQTITALALRGILEDPGQKDARKAATGAHASGLAPAKQQPSSRV